MQRTACTCVACYIHATHCMHVRSMLHTCRYTCMKANVVKVFPTTYIVLFTTCWYHIFIIWFLQSTKYGQTPLGKLSALSQTPLLSREGHAPSPSCEYICQTPPFPKILDPPLPTDHVLDSYSNLSTSNNMSAIALLFARLVPSSNYGSAQLQGLGIGCNL